MNVLSLIRRKFGIVDKTSFYDGKNLMEIEWWISYCSEYPDVSWARLRVFSDGSADAAFEESKVYGFDNREFASYFLGEDGYIPFNSMDEDDEQDIGAKNSEITPPTWNDHVRAGFEYLGTR